MQNSTWEVIEDRKAMRGNSTDEPIISLAYFPQLGSLTNNDENQSWVFS